MDILHNKKTLFILAGSFGAFISGVLYGTLSSNANVFMSWVVSGALDAAFISTFMIGAQAYYQTKALPPIKNLINPFKTGLIFGAIGGLVAFMVVMMVTTGQVGRLIGWAISGGAAGYVVSRQIPNMDMKHSIIAGAIGAFIGCLAMLFNFGYTTGVVITGAAIGLVVALAEEILRKSWVNVSEYSDVISNSGVNMAKLINQYTLTLGTEPIRIGYSADMDIRIKASGIAIEKETSFISMQSDKFYITDIKSGIKTELLKDTPIKIQNCELTVNYK